MTEKLSSEEPVLSSEEPTEPSAGSDAGQPLDATTKVCPLEKHWIELRYLHCDGTPVSGAQYYIESPALAICMGGSLNDEGFVHIPISPSEYEILKKDGFQYWFRDDPQKYYPLWWRTELTPEKDALAEAIDWVWGVLQGGFNKDPSFSQIVADTIITLIPGVDQVGDGRDIAAILYNVIEFYCEDEEQQKSHESTLGLSYEVWLWGDALVTAVGAFPEFGTAIKGVAKSIIKCLKDLMKLAGDLTPKQLTPIWKLLLEICNYLAEKHGNVHRWLKEDFPSKLKDGLDWAEKRIKFWLKTFEKVVDHYIEKFGQLTKTTLIKIKKAIKRALEIIEDMKRKAFNWLEEQLDHILKGKEPPKNHGSIDTKAPQEAGGNTLVQGSQKPSETELSKLQSKPKPEPKPEPKPKPKPEPKPEQPAAASPNPEKPPAKNTTKESGQNQAGNSTQKSSDTSKAGEPISMVTGEELLSLDDFVWEGPLPFIWTRFYRTAQSATDGSLGFGWLTPLDEWLDVSAEGVAYHDSEGRTVKLPLPELGGYSLNLPEHLRLYRERGCFRLVGENRPDRIFAGEMGRCRLNRWRNEYGQSIEWVYDSFGQAIALVASWGKTLVIQREGNHITAIGPGRWGENGYEPTAAPFVHYQYDDQGDLVGVFDRLDQGDRYAYREHMIVQRTFASGFNVYFEWDVYAPHGRCLHNWGDGGIYDCRFEWTDGGISRVIDSRGGVTEYQHNANALLLQQISPEGRTTRYVYNDSNLLQNLIDPAGHVTTYEYDDEGQLTAIIDPLGQTTCLTYNEAGKPLTLTDPLGQVWARAYDQKGRLVQTQDPQGSITRFSYNEQGLLATVTNALGQTRTLLWDEQSRLVGEIGFDGLRQRYQYDAEDRIIAVVTQDQRSTHYQYDAAGQVIAVKSPDGGTVKLQYNAAGLLTDFTDALGRTTQYHYADGLSQITERIDPNGQVLRYQYDSERNLIALINAKGEQYSLSYDKDEKLVQELGFDGRDQRYQYDIAGNLRAYAQRGESAWQVTRFQRDPLGQLLIKRGPDGSTAEFTYDPLGRLATATNDHAHLQFAYNPLGQIIREVQNDAVVQHEYNLIAQRTATITPDGQRIDYVYDAQNRLQQVTLNGQPLTQHRFDELGQEIARQQGLLVSWYDYDPMGRLARHQAGVAGSRTAVLGRSYGYDTTGNLTVVDDFRQGQTRYLYDPADRLIQVDGLQPERFIHDPAGNLIGMDQESGGLVKGDRLILLGDRHFTYDAAGNLVEERRGKGQKIISRYVYDSDNRLIRSETPKGVVSYGYDALGRRIAKETEHSETRFVYDGARLLAEIEGERRRTYLFEPSSFRPLARIDRQGAKAENTVYYYHLDHLGTPKEMTDAQGRIVWSARYRAYGALALADVEQIDNPLRFQGQYFDTETGLHYNLNRYYDPAAGRFIHQDPIGLEGGDNLYQYAPNPVNWIDPFGLTKKGGDGGGVAKSRGYDRPEIETKSGTSVKKKDATDKWDEFLGPDQTNIDPRDGLPDPDRIWSKDGKRSIRFGEHEMSSKPNKLHYHQETWYDDKVENVLQRTPQ